MKVLYIYEHVVDDIEGKYYHPYLNSFLARYNYFSKQINCIFAVQSIQANDISDSEVIDQDVYNLSFLPKIFSVQGLISIRKIIKTIKNEVKSVDLVITKQPSLWGSIALYYANKYGKESLTEMVGCPWDAYWNHSLIGKLLAPFMFLLTRFTTRNSKNVIYVTSNFLQYRYPTRGRNIGCSDVVPNLISKEVFKNKSRSFIWNPKDYVSLATLAGIDVKYKGQAKVIEALALLNKKGYNFHYFIAGPGNPAYLKRVIMKNRAESYVHIVGSLPHDEVFNLLDNISLYIQPSKQEGLPRALVEAMGRGCSAIGTHAGGVHELLDDRFLYNASSKQELCSLLEGLTTEILQSQIDDNYSIANCYKVEDLNKKRIDFYSLIKNKYLDGKEEKID